MSTTDETGQLETYEPVRVHVASVESGVQLAAPKAARRGYRAHYETFALTANDPVQCILPEDEDRVEAFVLTLDQDIVIGTKSQCSAGSNTVTSVPQPIGTYIPAKTNGGAIFPFPVKDCNAVYAGVTTSSNSRVSVAAYYRT